MENENLIFGAHLVAFIDILGQSRNLKQFYKIKWWEDRKRVIDILSSTYGNVLKLRSDINNFVESFPPPSAEKLGRNIPRPISDKYIKAAKKILIQNVSDSIILTVQLQITDGIIPLRSVFGVLGGIGISMMTSLNNGYCFRAGIEFGPCIFNQSSGEVYGSALSESVAYEKRADYPRIIVGNHLNEYLNDFSRLEKGSELDSINAIMAKRCLSIINRDEEGLNYIDYLGKGFKDALGSVDNKPMIKGAIKFIKSQLSENKSDQKIYNKFYKLKQYFESRKDVWGNTIINF
jgi:hypothetical protein